MHFVAYIVAGDIELEHGACLGALSRWCRFQAAGDAEVALRLQHEVFPPRAFVTLWCKRDVLALGLGSA